MDLDVLHLWKSSLLLPPETERAMWEVLSEEERLRAGRCTAPELRRCRIVSRGVLRHALADLTRTPAERLCFTLSPKGKPVLSFPEVPISFSVTHSHDLLLIAAIPERSLGIDVEQIRAVERWERLAARYFSPAERKKLALAPPPRRQELFFQGWTRREAYLKALGIGLSGLSQCREMDGEGNTGPANGWTFIDISPPGYVATLAVEGPLPQIYWHLNT